MNDSLYMRFKTNVEQKNLIREGDSLLLSFSGGADSTALFYLLLELKKEIPFTLSCMLLNHSLRVEADTEIEKLTSMLTAHNIPYFVRKVDILKQAKASGRSVEEEGREERRGYLLELVEKHRFTKVLTAHHQDDQAETILMRLTRGTGLSGITAMADNVSFGQAELIRPLLPFSKKELLKYLTEHDYLWFEDASNQDPSYARNRIRHETLKSLEKINPNATTAITRSIDHIREEAELLDLLMLPYEKEIEVTENGAQIQRSVFRKEELPYALPSFKKRMIRRIAQRAGLLSDFESVHVETLLSLVCGKSTGVVDLPDGFLAKAGQQVFQIKRKEKDSEEERDLKDYDALKQVVFPVHLFLSDQGEILWKGLRIRKTAARESFDKIFSFTLPYDMINSRLVFRTRRSGDYLKISNGRQTKKLGRFFIDRKVPREKRDTLLMLADGSEILWIPGLFKKEIHQQGDPKKLLSQEFNLAAEGYNYDE